MAIQNTGQIKITDVSGEFGGSAPHALSEYYGAATGVPNSGQIALSDFYGTSDSFSVEYVIVAGGGGGGKGGNPPNGNNTRGRGGSGSSHFGLTYCEGGDGGRTYASNNNTTLLPNGIQLGNVTASRGHGGNRRFSGSNGKVMIRYAGNQTCNGGAVATSGGYTTHVFNNSGTFQT